jgi:hypothetical protein
MKLVPKNILKPSKIKLVSTWKSVFSLKRKESNRNKSVSKLVTSTPNTFSDLKIHIRKTKCVNDASVTKKRGQEKAKLVTSIKEGISKKYLVGGDTDDDDDIPHMYTTHVKVVISKPPHPAISEMKNVSFCRWTLLVAPLKRFECAICLDTFVNNGDLLT